MNKIRRFHRLYSERGNPSPALWQSNTSITGTFPWVVAWQNKRQDRRNRHWIWENRPPADYIIYSGSWWVGLQCLVSFRAIPYIWNKAVAGFPPWSQTGDNDTFTCQRAEDGPWVVISKTLGISANGIRQMPACNVPRHVRAWQDAGDARPNTAPTVNKPNRNQ